MNGTPPAVQETRYGWSIEARKWFHRAEPSPWRRGFRARCLGANIDQSSTDRHSVPAHLRPCPRCFPTKAGA